MTRNHYLLLAGVVAISLAVAEPATAATRRVTRAAATKTTEVRLNNLKTKGSAEIDRRLARLNAALTQVQGLSGLADADKAAAVKSIQDQITALTALKAKLAAEKDLPAARLSVKSINDDYKVYRVVLPSARMHSAANLGQASMKPLLALHEKLTLAVRSTNGDKAAAQAKLDSMKAHLDSAQKKFTAASQGLAALKPTDFAQSQATLATLRDQLKAAREDLKAAHEDGKLVAKALGVQLPEPSAAGAGAATGSTAPAAATGSAPAAGSTTATPTGGTSAPSTRNSVAPAAPTAPATNR